MTSARALRAVPDVLRYGIGVRVSRVMGRGGDSFHTPTIQEQGARRAIAAAGGVVDETVGEAGVFFDLDVSGGTAPSSRAGLGAAIDLVRSGRLHGIAVYDLSRWSRETVSGLRELEEIAALGGEVISASETIDLVTPGGRFATTVQLAAHQMRRDEASRAWKATHDARARQGKHHGLPPIGYLRTDQGDVALDPLLHAAVAEIFNGYAAGLTSLTAAARTLSTLRGSTVWPSTVSDLLRNPFYWGRVRLNGVEYPAEHQALVDDETWHAVQRRLQVNANRPVRGKSSTASFALAGLLRCDPCGHVLWQRKPGYQRAHLGRPVLVTCRTARLHPGSCAGVGTPPYQPIEDAALAAVLHLAARLRDDSAAAAQQRSATSRAAVDVAALRAELADVGAALARAGGLLARGVMSEEVYALTVRDLERDATTARARLLVAEERSAAPRPAALVSAAAQLQRLWPDMTALERNAALRPFLSAVRLRPAQVKGQPLRERLDVLDLDGQALHIPPA